MQKHQELLTHSAKYVVFAARREPQCTTKNILELTITGKIKQIPIVPNALIAASIAMGCVLFRHARLREIFGGNDRERMEYVGGDKTIVRDVDAQLNNLNKAFPVKAKVWESKRGEDRTKETANRLLWESFIVLQDNQAADEQQQRAFIPQRWHQEVHQYLRRGFRRRGVPAWWRISGKTHAAPEPKARPNPSAGSEQHGVPPSASSSSDTTGRAPWWSSYQPTGKEHNDGTVVNATAQAILEISAKGEDDRRVMPEKHDVHESITIIEQRTAFSNLHIGVSFVLHRKSGVVMPITKFGPAVKAGKSAFYWERCLRHVVATLLIFDERRRADRIVAAYLNKPNLAWLQLYAYMRKAKLFGATAYSDGTKE